MEEVEVTAIPCSLTIDKHLWAGDSRAKNLEISHRFWSGSL